MRYELRLTAYDVMDQVHIAGTLYGTQEGPSDVRLPALMWTTAIRGTGQLDPAQWTTDTLIAALEAL